MHCKVIFFSVNDNNPLCFRPKLLKRIYKVIITTDYNIREEKLQYNIYREARKISTVSSGKIDKYEYLTGEEIYHMIKVE